MRSKRGMNILLIDDDQSLRKSIRMALETMGHKVTEAGDGTQAQELLGHTLYDVVFLDLKLGREKGLDVLVALLRLAPGLAVIVITAYATVETAVEAMRRGAVDFLPKPFTPDELRRVLDRVVRIRRLESHVEELEEQVRAIVPEADLQTEEALMRQAIEVTFRAAPTEATILLRGESGTGKGVLARAIHARSQRASGPFITVNCPSLSAEKLQQMAGQRQDIFRPLAQWRQRDLDDVEPVQQVLSERAAGDGRLQIAIRRRQNAHVARPGARFADSFVLPFL